MDRATRIIGRVELAFGTLALAVAAALSLSLLWLPDRHGFGLLGAMTFGVLGLTLLVGVLGLRLRTPWRWIAQLPVLGYAGWFIRFMFG